MVEQEDYPLNHQWERGYKVNYGNGAFMTSTRLPEGVPSNVGWLCKNCKDFTATIYEAVCPSLDPNYKVEEPTDPLTEAEVKTMQTFLQKNYAPTVKIEVPEWKGMGYIQYIILAWLSKYTNFREFVQTDSGLNNLANERDFKFMESIIFAGDFNNGHIQAIMDTIQNNHQPMDSRQRTNYLDSITNKQWSELERLLWLYKNGKLYDQDALEKMRITMLKLDMEYKAAYDEQNNHINMVNTNLEKLSMDKSFYEDWERFRKSKEFELEKIKEEYRQVFENKVAEAKKQLDELHETTFLAHTCAVCKAKIGIYTEETKQLDTQAIHMADHKGVGSDDKRVARSRINETAYQHNPEDEGNDDWTDTTDEDSRIVAEINPRQHGRTARFRFTNNARIINIPSGDRNLRGFSPPPIFPQELVDDTFNIGTSATNPITIDTTGQPIMDLNFPDVEQDRNLNQPTLHRGNSYAINFPDIGRHYECIVSRDRIMRGERILVTILVEGTALVERYAYQVRTVNEGDAIPTEQHVIRLREMNHINWRNSTKNWSVLPD